MTDIKGGIKIKKITCAVLLLLMLLSAASCKDDKKTEDTTAAETTALRNDETIPLVTEPPVTADTTTAEDTTAAPETEPKSDTYEENVIYDPTEYTASWNYASLSEQIMANDQDWVFTGRDLYHDGCAGSVSHDSVFTLVNKNYVGEYDKYKFDFSLYTPESGDERDNDKEKALFVGLRRQMLNVDTDDGIWLAFKDNSMWIKGAGAFSESMTEILLPYGFKADFRRIYIEDNQSQNVIKVFLGNDDGKKELVCKLYVSKNEIKQVTSLDVYAWQDRFNTKVTTVDLCAEMYKGGNVMIWNSGRGQTYIKDVAFKIS